MNSANTLKINDYLNHIWLLKKKLEEGQLNTSKMEPSQILNLNASAQELPEDLQFKKKPSPVPNTAEIQVHMKTPTMEPIPNAADMKVQMETPTAEAIPNVA